MTDLFDQLNALGIAHETHDHPPVFTVEQSRAHWATIDAAHTKNLLLKDAGGAFWLVVMPAEGTLNLKALPARIGSKRLRFASADDLLRLLGVESGAVSAFALINDRDHVVRPVIERALIDTIRIAQHPLDNARTTVIPTPGLLTFLNAIGFEPLIADLDD